LRPEGGRDQSAPLDIQFQIARRPKHWQPKVTLRRKRMWDFLERVITVALPRSRDFQGIDPKNIDQDGNLTFGIKEHIAFPEISPEKINFIFGFEITAVTTAANREEGIALFKKMGFPIRTEETANAKH